MGQRPPRVTRKLAVGIIERTQAELISARAEEPGKAACFSWRTGGDLRACGGTEATVDHALDTGGRSPRVRRNHVPLARREFERGSISARAEEHHLSAAAPGCGRVRLALSDGLGAQLAAEPAVAESDMSAWARGNMRFVSDHHRLVSCGVRS